MFGGERGWQPSHGTRISPEDGAERMRTILATWSMDSAAGDRQMAETMAGVLEWMHMHVVIHNIPSSCWFDQVGDIVRAWKDRGDRGPIG